MRIFITRGFAQGNIAFKRARFIKRMGAKPFRTHKAASSAVGLTNQNYPKLGEFREMSLPLSSIGSKICSTFSKFTCASAKYPRDQRAPTVLSDLEIKRGTKSPKSSQLLGKSLPQLVNRCHRRPGGAHQISLHLLGHLKPKPQKRLAGGGNGGLANTANCKGSAKNFKNAPGSCMVGGGCAKIPKTS